MADVFISYKREERQEVERLAQELRRLGLDVWFDASLNAGEAFSDEIDREARAAKIILVCWSPAARASDWVKAEALIGFTNKNLAACYASGPDGFDPPAPFNSIHAEDLRAWLMAPSHAHSGWKSLLRRIGKLSGREDIESYGALDVQAPASVLRAWVERHASSPLFMAVDELLRVRDVEESERARLEQEARERRAHEEAQRRAREDAASEAREEQERRERAEREERTRQDTIAQAAQDADAQRRARRMPWTIIIGGGVAAAFVVGIVLNVGDEPAVATYAPDIERNFMMACEAQGSSNALCACTWDKIEAEILPGDFAALERLPGPQRETHSLTAQINGYVDACNASIALPTLPAADETRVEQDSRVQSPPGPALPEMVRIPGRNFEVGRYEVTFAQWDACVAGGGCSGYSPSDEGWGRGNHPVINVNWNDAQAYAQWLSQRTGQRYRLLTSAEWEVAARAGTMTEYSWGNLNPVCSQNAANGANFSDCTDDRARPVGSFQPNAFGLYDMHGNVYEWVSDCHEGCDTGRVLRSGSWTSAADGLTSTFTNWKWPGARDNYVGFRIARSLG